MTELSHTDDATTLLQKLTQAQNEVEDLTTSLISKGNELNKVIGEYHEIKATSLILKDKELNKVNGEYREIKARIKAVKERINTLKILIRAEANSLSNI